MSPNYGIGGPKAVFFKGYGMTLAHDDRDDVQR
jgi:hypothetical protein